MIDFSSLRWTLLETVTFKVESYKDFHTIKLKGSTEKLIRLDVTEKNLFNNNYVAGYLQATTSIFASESVIFSQQLFIGSNLIILPNYINKIANFYINLKKFAKGEYSVKSYKPATQIIINPLDGQPVILGQESLTAIENLNKNLDLKLVENLLKEIEIKLNNTSNSIQEIERTTNQNFNIINTFLTAL